MSPHIKCIFIPNSGKELSRLQLLLVRLGSLLQGQVLLLQEVMGESTVETWLLCRAIYAVQTCFI